MKTKHTLPTLFLAVFATLHGVSSASAASLLGSAQSFAVLGQATVTNAHNGSNASTQLYGNLGVTPGVLGGGFYPDGVVGGGTIHINDELAQLALADAASAYASLVSTLPSTVNYSGFILGSAEHATLTPGIYHFDSSAQLTGMLTLDFQSNPNAQFIFQIGSTLTTASSSSIHVINGNSLSSVYWQVGSSATLGQDTSFVGNILAHKSISFDSRASILCGRAFALTGAVTLTDNLISNNCTAENYTNSNSDYGSLGFSGGQTATIPEPATLMWMLVGAAELLRRPRLLRQH